MARYIDIEAEDFDLMDIDYLRLEDGSDGYDIYVYRDDVEDYLKNRPTADVIERDKIRLILNGYDGSMPSMITCFNEIQKLVESEEK